MSLRPDLAYLARIDTSDFYNLLEHVFKAWIKDEDGPWLQYLRGAWQTSPGPGDGGASAGQMYCLYYPGFSSGFNRMSDWFAYPKKFGAGWEYYRDSKIVKDTFPKWKMGNNLKHLPGAFRFARMVCDETQRQLR